MLADLIAGLARALAGEHIPYMLIGGQAVLVYAEPRLTRDVDITLGVGKEGLPQVERVAARLRLRILVDAPADFVARTMVLPCADDASGLRVDFIFSWSPYEQQAIARARHIEVAHTPVSFASPEDLIVHKIVAGRARDLEDVRGVVAKVSPLDLEYIRTWLQQFEEVTQRPLRSEFNDLCSQGPRGPRT